MASPAKPEQIVIMERFMLRVAMISRSTMHDVPGGDTVQIIQTARHLSARGVCVDVLPASAAIDYGKYDLLHFFNITRPGNILYHIGRTSLPFVVSTIHIDYSAFDRRYRTGIPGIMLRLFSSDQNEYIKALGRALLGRDKLRSFFYLLKGQSGSICKILQKASLLLPNSDHEYQRLKCRYKCMTPYRVVHNGIDPDVFKYSGAFQKDDRLVICVARIEGIKNQLNVIRALNGTKYQLLLIGSPAPNQLSYYHLCRKAAKENVQFINHVPQQQLVQYYRKAKVHILASWFETTGLSSLEAAAMGCNVVITDKGDTKEYFQDDAFYCDPASPASMYEAVEKAASCFQVNEDFINKIQASYTWQHASRQTLQAYHQIIQS